MTTKNGYTVTSPAIINSDETISTTLDDTKNYIFGTEGNYTVASADNVKTNNYPDLMQVHKTTVPEGVNVTSEKYEVGSDTQIGDATSQFKGTATLGAGVKVSFNGNDTIEVTSGEITFNADTSTFGSLDSGAITINDGTITLSATSETIYFYGTGRQESREFRRLDADKGNRADDFLQQIKLESTLFLSVMDDFEKEENSYLNYHPELLQTS